MNNRLLIPQQKYPSELVYSLKCITFDCITLTKDILTLNKSTMPECHCRLLCSCQCAVTKVNEPIEQGKA